MKKYLLGVLLAIGCIMSMSFTDNKSTIKQDKPQAIFTLIGNIRMLSSDTTIYVTGTSVVMKNPIVFTVYDNSYGYTYTYVASFARKSQQSFYFFYLSGLINDGQGNIDESVLENSLQSYSMYWIPITI